jgi:DNA mismatch repair protein MutS
LDGVSIAWAVGDYINGVIKAKTMFATHFYELTALADTLDSANCYNVSIKEAGDEIFFIRKVVEGRGSKSYGIQVAKLAGLPDMVVENAKSILRRMEREEERVKQRKEEGKEDEEVEKSVEQEKEYVTHPVVDELKLLNLEKTSPIEALNKLYEMKEKLE